MADDSSSPQATESRFTFALLSDVGRVRKGNEDCAAAEPAHGIFVVCDGMGGAAAGEVASRLAVDAFIDYLKAAARTAPESLLQDAADAANTKVYRESLRPGLGGMGTTLVALVLFPEGPDGALWLLHVGDSRCYRTRGGELTALTRDHSFVEEQVMAGQLTREEAELSPLRNIITRAIGAASEVRAEIRRLHAQPGDVYLLASDGLTRELTDAELQAQLASAGTSGLDATCRSLVDAANAGGGHDNITVLLLRVDAEGTKPPRLGLH